MQSWPSAAKCGGFGASGLVGLGGGGEQAVLAQQRGEGEQADAAGGGGEEVAAGAFDKVAGEHGRLGQGWEERLRTQSRIAWTMLRSGFVMPIRMKRSSSGIGTAGKVGLHSITAYFPSSPSWYI